MANLPKLARRAQCYLRELILGCSFEPSDAFTPCSEPAPDYAVFDTPTWLRRGLRVSSRR